MQWQLSNATWETWSAAVRREDSDIDEVAGADGEANDCESFLDAVALELLTLWLLALALESCSSRRKSGRYPTFCSIPFICDNVVEQICQLVAVCYNIVLRFCCLFAWVFKTLDLSYEVRTDFRTELVEKPLRSTPDLASTARPDYEFRDHLLYLYM